MFYRKKQEGVVVSDNPLFYCIVSAARLRGFFSVLRSSTQCDQFSADTFGNLFQFAHAEMLTIDLKVEPRNRYQDVTRLFRAIHHLASFPVKNFA
jgi:hypothetical protein